MKDYKNNSTINKIRKRLYLFLNNILIILSIFLIFIFFKNLSLTYNIISILVLGIIITFILALFFIYLNNRKVSKLKKEEIKLIKILLNKYKIDINSINIELLRQIIKEEYFINKESKKPTFYEIISILISLLAFFISVYNKISGKSFILIFILFMILFLLKLFYNVVTEISELKQNDYELFCIFI